MTDGKCEQSAAVTVTVIAMNDCPVAAEDSVVVDEDGSITIEVLENDSDVDGNVLQLLSASIPDHGGKIILDTTAGTVTYT